ncbi:MAG: DNA helicase RecG, partial [Phormidium sp.]
MINPQPDWVRWQKALEVEEKSGFTDLIGNQYRFSEFLCLTFGKPPTLLDSEWRKNWQEMASRFAKYPNLPITERENLVKLAKLFLQASEEECQKIWQQRSKFTNQQENSETLKELPTVNLPLPTPQTEISLDQPLKEVPELGITRSRNLAKLELYTVRDLLFYYPRDHIDYSQRVDISQLEAGETVTIVASIKRCECFTSPKNKKLTILEIVLQDRYGKIRLSRFFAGNQYSNRGWQEAIKRRYPVGAIIAASGLVKETKYGLTLQDPEMEMLASPGDNIESTNIGRVVPVYPLTEGVPADVVRQAVM